MSGNTLTYMND